MVDYFATVQQSSETGVTERVSPRRREHDFQSLRSRLPQRGATGPKAMTMGPQSGLIIARCSSWGRAECHRGECGRVTL
jgi:hypothetical protein